MSTVDERPEVPFGNLIAALRERAKELACLYRIEEILVNPDAEPAAVGRAILATIPAGMQHPDLTQVELTLAGETFRTPGLKKAPDRVSADIRIQNMLLGELAVSYAQPMPEADEGPFLADEVRLVRTIADRLALFAHHRRMREHFVELERAQRKLEGKKSGTLRIVLDLLAKTDRGLHHRISHKMLNHLCRIGIPEAEQLLVRADIPRYGEDEALERETNRPRRSQKGRAAVDLAGETFRIASEHLTEEDILGRVERWMQEDKLAFLIRAAERLLPLPDLADAIRRYHEMSTPDTDLPSSVRAGVRVSLIRRFLSDDLAWIRMAKDHVEISDFHTLLSRMIYSAGSHGRIGGKSAGLFLASLLLARAAKEYPELADVRVPATWHVTSDMHTEFLYHNNLEEIAEQKYKDLAQIRSEYPHIVHLCRNSHFPPELAKGLSIALESFGDRPIIVRSSSLLEDRAGTAFSGKYKSLFLANQGSKEERLVALFDAVAEIYASLFGPDPMEYRTQHGLIDFVEEMGILLQEVVGTRVGPYFLPAFAGVAFSRNEFRWSPRIRREDGLIRLVPGLGTRAVDRVGEDYPVMFAPGQPGLRVSVSVEEMLRYSPRFVDVIHLETNTFDTVPFAEVLAGRVDDYPLLPLVASEVRHGQVRPLNLIDTPAPGALLPNFEGLMAERSFAKTMRTMLTVLEKAFGSPVDIEFAHDGRHLHLLQCRTQSSAEDYGPSPIPRDLPPERVIFTARRFVSNGRVPDLTHIVYVDPDRYAELPTADRLKAVGRAVGQLNKLLPPRGFILLGPGRWGSRGDIKLGVPVNYSDISHAAMLVEIARRRGQFTPDLSFGTHFFQDLVEAKIRYLPLYPDDPDVRFNEEFLRGAPSVLMDLLPASEPLSATLRVIDVRAAANGRILRVLLNADLDEAIAFLADPEIRED
ncbi:MAG: PEP/pyruvate-binding domain-containing protein [Planctomycetes bacterium]|jgi:hypothetical protein|nr:PEP/pyruvate-binding domain-containing protein [Planctomycetota bacterium]